MIARALPNERLPGVRDRGRGCEILSPGSGQEIGAVCEECRVEINVKV